MKKQFLWIRLLVLALVLCMTLPTFAACMTEDEEGNETNNPSETSGNTEEETEFQPDALGDDLKFDTQVRVLGDKTYRYQVYCFEDEIEGDPIKETVYKRAMTVEDRLGIEIIMDTAANGAWGGATGFAKEVETAISTDPYDALACYNLTPLHAGANGLLRKSLQRGQLSGSDRSLVALCSSGRDPGKRYPVRSFREQ